MKSFLNFKSFVKILKTAVLLMITVTMPLFAKTDRTKELVFKSASQAISIVGQTDGYSILGTEFKFNPFSKNLLIDYLPDGYITVNDQVNITKLVVNTYFAPLVQNNDLAVLVLDINSLIPELSVKNINEVKYLIEEISSCMHAKNPQTILALKFTYTEKSKTIIDQLLSFTSIPILVKGVQIPKGGDEFLKEKTKAGFIKNLRYVSLKASLTEEKNTMH